jgi:drug/metabolite transporter (DMT)-like permease
MLYYLLPVASAILMSVTLLVLKFVSLELPHIPFSFWRVLFSSFSFMLFFRVNWKQEIKKVQQDYLWMLIVCKGFLGFFLYKILNLIALAHTTAINVSIFKAMVPILTVSISSLLFKNYMTKRQIASFIFSFFGVLLVITQGQFASLHMVDIYGELVALAATCIWVFHALIVQLIGKRLSSAFIGCMSTLIGAIFFLCISPIHDLIQLLYQLTYMQWLMLIYLSVVASMLGSWLFVYSIQELGAGTTTLIKFSLLPVFMMILSMLFLGVVPDAWQLLGAATIILSLFIGLYRRKTKPGVGAEPEEILRPKNGSNT